MSIFKKFFASFALITLFLPLLVFAQTSGINPPPTSGINPPPTSGINPPNDCVTSGKLCNPINAKSINEVIKKILEAVIKIGIPIIALAIVYSGFLFVSARGKPEKLKEAKSALLYTLIGAAILLGSWAIAQLISETVLAL